MFAVGKPSSAAALIAHHHRAADLVGTAEHLRRPRHVAAGQRAADRRRAHRLVDPVGAHHQLDRANLEVVGATELLEHVDVAGAVVTEVEVAADHDRLGPQCGHQHAFDERFRWLARLAGVEGQHDGGVDAGCGQQFEALTLVGEDRRRRLGTHDRGGVAVEREDDRTVGELGRQGPHHGDHRLMADVHAVVGADGHHAALARPRRRSDVGDHIHGG